MSYTKDPRYPKTGPNSKSDPSAGSKCIKTEMIHIGDITDIGPAPASRVYTRDYQKTTEPYGADDTTDLISPALGKNPFRI